MVVTRVEAVTKTKYKVYVDGQFAFILYKGELSLSLIHICPVLSEILPACRLH